MKHFMLTVFLLTQVVSFTFSQNKEFAFRDGSKLAIEGKLVGVVAHIQDGKPSKKSYYYFLKKEATIHVSIYSEWESGAVDALRVYTFTSEQLGTYGLSDVSENEVDEYYKNVRYGFNLSTDSETPFQYLEYSKWSSTGEAKSFSLITIYGEDKALIEALHAEIKALLPVKEE
jgi:hypothetical protein